MDRFRGIKFRDKQMKEGLVTEDVDGSRGEGITDGSRRQRQDKKDVKPSSDGRIEQGKGTYIRGKRSKKDSAI